MTNTVNSGGDTIRCQISDLESWDLHNSYDYHLTVRAITRQEVATGIYIMVVLSMYMYLI